MKAAAPCSAFALLGALLVAAIAMAVFTIATRPAHGQDALGWLRAQAATPTAGAQQQRSRKPRFFYRKKQPAHPKVTRFANSNSVRKPGPPALLASAGSRSNPVMREPDAFDDTPLQPVHVVTLKVKPLVTPPHTLAPLGGATPFTGPAVIKGSVALLGAPKPAAPPLRLYETSEGAAAIVAAFFIAIAVFGFCGDGFMRKFFRKRGGNDVGAVEDFARSGQRAASGAATAAGAPASHGGRVAGRSGSVSGVPAGARHER